MKEDKATKEASKAEAEENLAEATQSYDDTQQQLKADIVFFRHDKRSMHVEAQCLDNARRTPCGRAARNRKGLGDIDVR